MSDRDDQDPGICGAPEMYRSALEHLERTGRPPEGWTVEMIRAYWDGLREGDGPSA